MRILVTGSRDWDDRVAVHRALNEACSAHELNYAPDEYGNTMPDPMKVTIVHGDCPTGADHWADEWCASNFLEAERHPADWQKYGKPAGWRRNVEMVTAGADICLSFNRNASKGTTMCADLAEKAGIPTKRFEVRDPD